MFLKRLGPSETPYVCSWPSSRCWSSARSCGAALRYGPPRPRPFALPLPRCDDPLPRLPPLRPFLAGARESPFAGPEGGKRGAGCFASNVNSDCCWPPGRYVSPPLPLNVMRSASGFDGGGSRSRRVGRYESPMMRVRLLNWGDGTGDGSRSVRVWSLRGDEVEGQRQARTFP
jgi:hypothetical protein